jgi:4-amino-4-deoxy-L-arabinose transferase-like glycosyltransferase
VTRSRLISSRISRDGWILGGLTLAALLLRLVRLTRFELWVDEAATWHFARLAASGQLLEQIRLEPTPPLYYALIGVLMRLFGESDLVMRLPSAVIGAATVPAVFALGRRFFGRGTGYAAAVLLAVHPLHVFYSREARVYPLLVLESVLLWLFLRRALDDDRRRSWALFAGTLLAACYSHFYGLFLGATAGILILARRRRRGLMAVGLAGLAFAPYLVLTLPHLRTSGAAWSIERLYEMRPEEKRLGRTLEMGFVGAGYSVFLRQISRPPTPSPLRWTSLLAQTGLVFLAFAGARRRGKVGAFGFLTAAWLLPLLIPWTINHWRAIYHTGRHDFYVVGTLSVVLAAGLDELWRRDRRWRALAVLVALVLGAAAGHRLAALHQVPASDRNRAAGAWLAARAAESGSVAGDRVAGDRVIAMGIRRLVTEHYARLAGSEARFESFPASTDGHPGWSDTETLLEDEGALHQEARGRVAELGRELAPDATLYVLVRSYRRTETAVSADWLLDRHLLESLAAAGWRPAADAGGSRLGIAAFRPPAGKAGVP